MNLKLPPFRFVLMAAFVVPVQSLDGWKTEKFSSRPANMVTASSSGIVIKVEKSASPLIFPLKSKTKVNGFKIAGNFSALPVFKDVARQGEKGADDFPLRIGFIVPGEKRLTGVRKLFASEWVKHLFSQVPPEMGLDHIQFFNVTQNSAQVGKSRTHPASDLLTEEFFALVEKPGPFSYTHKLSIPLEAVGIWLSIDGDDTKSDFTVSISNLELMTE